MNTAMILAAGRGQRMRPLTDTTPKPLLEVKGKSLIEHHIERLVAAGFTHIVINHAWLGELIEQAIGEGNRFGVEISYSREGTALETAGGIVKAMPLIQRSSEHQAFAVVNGDIFSDYDFANLPVTLGDQLAHLVMVDNPTHNPDGDFVLQDGQLQLQGAPKFTFSGIAVYRPEFFAGMASKVLPLGPVFRQQIEQGMVSGELHSGFWCDVGTPERLNWLNQREQ